MENMQRSRPDVNVVVTVISLRSVFSLMLLVSPSINCGITIFLTLALAILLLKSPAPGVLIYNLADKIY